MPVSAMANEQAPPRTRLLQGGSSKEIALGLGISPRTIEFHRSNIMAKTGARNVADLVRYAVRNGISIP